MEPSVEVLLASRGVRPPPEDLEPLTQHWTKMRLLREQVDESTLADSEIAVTWSATGEERA